MILLHRRGGGVFVQERGLCPGRGVSVQRSLFREGDLCPGRGLCPGVSVQGGGSLFREGVSIRGGLYSMRGVPVQGGGLCQRRAGGMHPTGMHSCFCSIRLIRQE